MNFNGLKKNRLPSYTILMRFSLITVFLLLAGCANIIAERVELTGQVVLDGDIFSDNSGVIVTAGSVKTVSDYTGKFSLMGKIMSDRKIVVDFYYDGSLIKTIDTTVEYKFFLNLTDSHADRKIDFGTITI